MCSSTIECHSLNGFVVLIVHLCLLGVFGDTILANIQKLFFKYLPLKGGRAGDEGESRKPSCVSPINNKRKNAK